MEMMNMLTKAALVEQVSTETNTPKALVTHVLESAAAQIAEALAGGAEAVLPGLGKLKPKTTPARPGRNPRTGEAIKIAARKVAKFSAGKELKDRMN